MMSQIVETQVVMGNASQLALSIVQEVIGNECADKVGGVQMNEGILLNMIESVMQRCIARKLGEAA